MCVNRSFLKKWKPEEKDHQYPRPGEQIEISPNTVQRAYDFLQQRNIITHVRGIGLFVDPDAEEHILDFRREQFLENELPETLRNIYLLKIDMQQVIELYEKFVKRIFPLKNDETNYQNTDRHVGAACLQHRLLCFSIQARVCERNDKGELVFPVWNDPGRAIQSPGDKGGEPYQDHL